jgi:hypothetical protein
MIDKYKDKTQDPNYIFTLDTINQRYDPGTETWDVIVGNVHIVMRN